MCKIKLAIIGATGLVGQTLIQILKEKEDERFDIKLFASSKSENIRVNILNKEHQVMPLCENSFDDVDYALFFTNEDISKLFIPIANKKNVVIIDNSSAFRMDNNVKLIAYGANDNLLSNDDKLISNPNCCIIQAVQIIDCLKKFNINKIIYNTYQSVSGSGKKGIDDLIRCRKGLMPLFYETDISFTCIPKIGEYDIDNFTSEEIKLINETKKILNLNVDVLATCVRVPVMFSHGVSVQVDFANDFDLQEVINEFKKKNYIVVCENIVPSSVLSCKNDKVYVGRIRKHNHSLLFYCVADNIRVGAATNAYLILNKLIDLRSEGYEN